ncbi:MAG: hypothetical protein LQ340_007277, partial [Diploschistes diacapsis]
MSRSRNVFLVLLVLSFISNFYLHNYPTLKSCHFPTPPRHRSSPPTSLSRKLYNSFTGHAAPQPLAPFRLLALGDPQLEGDTSIHDIAHQPPPSLSQLLSNLSSTPSLLAKASLLLRTVCATVLSPPYTALQAYRKRLDLLGNDHYLAHIYRTVHRSTSPTHVAVLGDLLGSQWISSDEFERRAHRYWSRIFRGSSAVPASVTADPTIEMLGEDRSWSSRVINIAGNHDIGYAGDLTPERVRRFEDAFGRVNWEIVFQVGPISSVANDAGGGKASDAGTGEGEGEGEREREKIEAEPRPSTPAFLRLIILNSMNLDTPALHPELQAETYAFINDVIARSEPVENASVGTILLTHIPLHKDEGVCADGPYFSFHADAKGAGVKEQNHLSAHVSKQLLEGVFGFSGDPDAPGRGLGRAGLVVNGHDHAGCDVFHYLPKPAEGEGEGEGEGGAAEATTEPEAEGEKNNNNNNNNRESRSRTWTARRWAAAQDAVRAANGRRIPGIRELTLRSMMGSHGGFAHLISAWFDAAEQRWVFDVDACGAGVQHWWWAAHVLLLAAALAGGVVLVLEGRGRR